MPDLEPEDEGPWFRIVVARDEGDTIVRGLAEEAASMLRARQQTVLVTEEMDLTPPPDGLLVVAGPGGKTDAIAKAAERLAERAVALAVVTHEPPEGRALAHNLRRALRAAKALVLPRQLVITREALNIYGLEDEDARDRLDGIVELLVHESDRLHAKRTGWQEPDTQQSVEWVGPQARERDESEEERGGL